MFYLWSNVKCLTNKVFNDYTAITRKTKTHYIKSQLDIRAVLYNGQCKYLQDM